MKSVGTICQYLDSVLISRWSYSAQGPTSSLGGQRNIQLESTPARSKHGSNGTSKGSQGSQAPDTSPWARLRWGWFASTSWRAPATKWEVKNVPPFDFNNPEWVPTRTRFLLGKLKTLGLCLLFIDALGIPPQDPAQGAMVFAPDKVAFFRRLENVSAQDVIIRFVVSAIGWTSIFCVLNACYSLLAIISVTTGLAPVDQWPPLFGKLADCYSIRQFWGRFWHQTLRQRISSPSHFLTYSVFGLRKGSLVARYMNIWLTFVVSGLMHVAEEFGTGVALQQSGSMQFFCTEACGIMFEDAFQAIFHYAAGKRQRRGTKALGASSRGIHSLTRDQVFIAVAARREWCVHHQVLCPRRDESQPVSDFRGRQSRRNRQGVAV